MKKKISWNEHYQLQPEMFYAFVDLFHSWEKNEEANTWKIGHKFYKKVQGPRNWKISTKL